MKNPFKNMEAKNVPLLIGLVLFLFLILISILLNFNGLYGQDGYKYLQYTRALSFYLHSGPIPEDIYFPILYPVFGAVLNLVIPGQALCLQLLSIISYCLGYVLLERLIYLVYQPAKRQTISIYLLIFYAVSPYIFRFSLLVMSDMFAMLLCISVFYFAIRYDHFCKPSDLYLAILFSMAAVLTRNPSLVLIAIPIVIVFVRFYKNLKVLHLLIIVFITLVMLLPDYILRQRLFIFSELNGHFCLSYMAEKPNWSVLNWFKYSFHGINGYQSYRQPNIVYVFFNIFHSAYLFLGIVFLFFLKRRDFSSSVSKWLLFSILIYALFLAGFDSQNMRFLILSFPLVLVFLFPAFERISLNLSRKRLFTGSMIFIFLLQSVLSAYSLGLVYRTNKNDREIVKTLREYQGKTVYAFEVDGIIGAYKLNNKPINIWYQPISSIQANSLLILNPDKINSQFKGQVAEQNLHLLIRNGHPVLIRSFNDGVNLYQLNP